MMHITIQTTRIISETWEIEVARLNMLDIGALITHPGSARVFKERAKLIATEDKNLFETAQVKGGNW